jgi:peptidoglycan/LPS O-acetylase OafA/YrhL
MNRAHIPGLDGLRGFCVLIVLLGHSGLPYPMSGGAGVDLFFVLSGFLITRILHAERQRTGGIHFGNFYARRFLRLAPCLVLVCVYALGEAAIRGRELPLAQVGWSLSYLANWGRALFGVDLAPLSHTWSLAIEEQFYLIWPLVILGIDARFRSPAAKAVLLLTLAFGLAGYRCAMVGHYSATRIYMGLDTHMDGLVLGAALSYGALAMKGGLSERWSRLLGRVLAPAAMLGVFLLMGLITWSNPWMGRIGFSLIACAGAVFVADLVLGRHSRIAPLLGGRPIRFLGKISYGTYLWHYPLYHTADELFTGLPMAAMVAVKLVLSLAVATVSYYGFELPILGWKKRFESRTGFAPAGEAVRPLP